MADRSSQRCLTVPVDVTDFEAVKAAVAASVNTLGYPSHVFTAAGLSHPGYFVEQDVSVHERTMQLDYFGTLHVLKAFADMKARSPLAKELKGQEAHFVLFSSTAGMLSFVGFSSYAPAKYALRGLAETLRNELLPYKIHISIVYPPDTDTPGFAAEMEVKPEECAKISSWGGKPLDPAYVAREVVRQVSMRIFHICADPGTRLLVTATAGASPRPSLLTDVLLSPIAVLAAMGFRIAFDRVCVSGFLARERRVKLGASPAHSRSGSLSSYQ
jgi:NAD(P)-dependent dehydrogenase (short-subunit alcohol dehydrogenase family)